MAKDPAALIYIDKWIASTNGMKASFRGWYFDLLIYQYDKGSIPNDMDELAGICRVRPSEYDLFTQMVTQVLKQKFKQNEDGEWFNEVANETISKRKSFKDKRAKSGTIGVIVKKAKTIPGFKNSFLERLKNELFEKDIQELEEYKSESLLKQMLKLYINEDVNEDEDINKDKVLKGGAGGKNDPTSLDLEILEIQIKNEFSWKEGLVKEFKIIRPGFKDKDLEDYLEIFFKTIKGDGEEEKTVKDFKKHFNRWMLIQLNKSLTNGNRNSNKTKSDSELKRSASEAVDRMFGS